MRRRYQAKKLSDNGGFVQKKAKPNFWIVLDPNLGQVIGNLYFVEAFHA